MGTPQNIEQAPHPREIDAPAAHARRAQERLAASVTMCGVPRQFHGEAAQGMAAPIEDCFALLAAVDRYASWCPDVVRHVDVLDRAAVGQPSRVRMTIHVAYGALVRTFDLYLAIAVERPRTVKLTRVTDHPTNQEFNATWLLRPAGSTLVALALDAKLRVPWYIRAGGVADTIAKAFVTAASRELGAPSR